MEWEGRVWRVVGGEGYVGCEGVLSFTLGVILALG